MENNSITKEQAIELWYKFLDSDKVIKEKNTIGAAYTYYALHLKQRGVTVATINLMSDPIFIGRDNEINERSYRQLETQYGKYPLTMEECTQLRDSWVNRESSKEVIPFSDIDKLL